MRIKVIDKGGTRYEEVGSLFRSMREKQGLSGRTMSAKTGLARSTIWGTERKNECTLHTADVILRTF